MRYFLLFPSFLGELTCTHGSASLQKKMRMLAVYAEKLFRPLWPPLLFLSLYSFPNREDSLDILSFPQLLSLSLSLNISISVFLLIFSIFFYSLSLSLPSLYCSFLPIFHPLLYPPFSLSLYRYPFLKHNKHRDLVR